MNDVDIASRYLFIDMAIKNLELDLQHVKNGLFKIKGPYVELIEGMVSKAVGERRELKSVMYKRKIQKQFIYKQGDFSTYKFIANGQVQEKSFINHVIKKNVEEIMKELSEGD